MNGFCFPVVLGAEREMMWFLSLGSSQAQQGRQACKEILPVLLTCSKCPLRSCGPGAESPARTDCPGRAEKVSQRCDLSAWSSLLQLGKWDEGFHPAVSQLPKQKVSQSQWFNITKSVRSFFLMPWPLCSEWLFPKWWPKALWSSSRWFAGPLHEEQRVGGRHSAPSVTFPGHWSLLLMLRWAKVVRWPRGDSRRWEMESRLQESMNLSGGLSAASTAGDGTPGSPESGKGRQLLREHLQKKKPGRSVSWIAQTKGQHAKETETFLLAAWHHWWCLLRVCFDQIFISTQRTLSSLLLLHGKATMVWRPSTIQLCCWSAWKLCLQASVTLLRKWGSALHCPPPGGLMSK